MTASNENNELTIGMQSYSMNARDKEIVIGGNTLPYPTWWESLKLHTIAKERIDFQVFLLCFIILNFQLSTGKARHRNEMEKGTFLYLEVEVQITTRAIQNSQDTNAIQLLQTLIFPRTKISFLSNVRNRSCRKPPVKSIRVAPGFQLSKTVSSIVHCS